MRRPLAHDDLWSLAVPSDPQLSPDGATVAFTVTRLDRDSDGYRREIWAVPFEGGSARRLTSGDRDSSARWSPAGGEVAFLRATGPGAATELWVLPWEAGEARKLADLPGGAGEPVWSPDGSRLALSAPVRAERGGDGEAVVADRLDYKADGAGLTGDTRSHLFVVDSGSGTARQVTFGDFSASTPVWSPDGERLAYSASTAADRDLEVEAVVHTVGSRGGRPAPVSPPGGLFHVSDWSADGTTLLVHGQTRLRSGHDSLFALPAAGGAPRDLLESFDRNVMAGAPGYPGAAPRFDTLAGDGAAGRVVFCARERGAVHAYAVAAGGGTPEVLAGGDLVIGGLSVRAGRVVFVAASPDSPGEVWAGGRRLTGFFGDALPDVDLLAPEPQTFTAPDGTALHGWVLRSRDAEGPQPLLVDVHGGPHNAWGPAFDGFHLYHQTLAARGWTVLTLNPRGSDGYGEAFWRAVIGGWGISDEGDFMAAVDALVERGVADPERLVVAGYSYGGYMSCWLPTRTRRFRAAIAGGCVSDLVSLAGTSDLGRHLARVELEAAVGEDTGRLLEMSPISGVSAVETPTLILHGEADQRCPVGQAEEWFAALRDRRVEVEMVRYPGAGHLFILGGRPSQRLDYGRRLEEWAVEHTTDAPPSPKARRLRRSAALLEQRLAALTERHRVPGASLAVLCGDRVVTAAAGVLNLETGAPATPDSLFQIGSITKVYTASLVMQLVDEGRLNLDAPAVEALPELRLGDPDATKTVTMRHLLSHTSGIEGDHFPDTGRGDDCLARYVAGLEQLGLSHPPGATMSYCNSGYVIAGRTIEVLTGGTWDAALAERICRPAGLEHTFTLPEEVLRFGAAAGHVSEPDGPPALAPVWALPRSCGPAGLVCSTASDVARFASLHLRGGGIVSERSARAMRQPQVRIPDPHTLGAHWGLGWILFGWGREVFGHDGNTIGQSAFLRVVPGEDLALVLLTNGGNAQDLYRDLFSGLLWELAGVEMPERPRPPAEAVEPTIDLDRHTGLYERVGCRVEVSRRDGKLHATVTATGPLASLVADPVTEYPLVAVDQDLFVARPEGVETWMPFVFYRLDDGSRYVHFGARATPKVS